MVFLTPRGVALLFDVPLELVEEALEEGDLEYLKGRGIEYREAEAWAKDYRLRQGRHINGARQRFIELAN